MFKGQKSLCGLGGFVRNKESRILELATTIAWYGGCVADIEPERIIETVTNVIKGKKGIEMAETIQRGIFSQGKAEGIAIGEARSDVRATLKQRFHEVPQEIKEAIQSMMDLVALESLLAHAESCTSLDEFAEALK